LRPIKGTKKPGSLGETTGPNQSTILGTSSIEVQHQGASAAFLIALKLSAEKGSSQQEKDCLLR